MAKHPKGYRMSHSVWGDWKITADRKQLVWIDPDTNKPNSDYYIIVSDGLEDVEGEVDRLKKWLPESLKRDEAIGKLGVIFGEIKEDQTSSRKYITDELVYRP